MRILSALLAVAVCSSTLLVSRQQPMGQGPGGMMMGGEMPGKLQGIIADLKLTDDQKKEFDKMKFDMMKQLIGQGSKVALTWVELQELMHADKPERAAIEKKIDDLTSQTSSVGKLFVGQWFAVNKMLTPDQQKIWKGALGMRPMMNRRMGGMQKMHERMMKMREEKEDDDKK